MTKAAKALLVYVDRIKLRQPLYSSIVIVGVIHLKGAKFIANLVVVNTLLERRCNMRASFIAKELRHRE